MSNRAFRFFLCVVSCYAQMFNETNNLIAVAVFHPSAYFIPCFLCSLSFKQFYIVLFSYLIHEHPAGARKETAVL